MRSILWCGLVMTVVVACGGDKDGAGFDPSMLGGTKAPAGDKKPDDKKSDDKKPDDKKSDDKKPDDKTASTDPVRNGPSSTPPPVATPIAGAANKVSGPAAAKFAAWTPLHSFLGAPIVGAVVVSKTEAIVRTSDNHVGVTLNSGNSWGFERLTTGSASAVVGAPGGPFVVAGPKGFLSLSADGKLWTDLPRYINDDLHTVLIGGGRIVAVGKNGGFVAMSTDGSNPISGYFPSKFRASGLRLEGKRILATNGKKALESTDGIAWSPLETPTSLAPSELATSQGLCGIGKVGKRRAVVCTVAGTAYGIGPTETIVVGAKWVGVTTTGKTWAMAPLPFKSVKSVVGKPGGPYHLGDGRGLVASSSDGKAWEIGSDLAVLDGAPAYTARPDACGDALPSTQETCKISRSAISPGDVPDVTGIRFDGEVGLALGGAAMVGMTTDGGATWKVHSGFGLGGVQGFDLAGDKIIALGTTKVAVSTDAGKTFRTVLLPPKTPALLAVHIASDGIVYVAGRGGTILKGDSDLTIFNRLDTGAKNKSDYAYIHEAAGAIFVAGTRGELMRSENKGTSWMPIATGLPVPLQQMSAEGDEVLAVSTTQRYSGNKLLRSSDGGRHFFVQRELSQNGSVSDFSFKGGVITYNGLRSSDYGATWATAGPWQWDGSIDIGDGSGVRITNISRYESKDRFYVIGPTEGDLTIVDSFYNKGAWLRCAASSGCWMVSGGQLYRPR